MNTEDMEKWYENETKFYLELMAERLGEVANNPGILLNLGQNIYGNINVILAKEMNLVERENFISKFEAHHLQLQQNIKAQIIEFTQQEKEAFKEDKENG